MDGRDGATEGWTAFEYSAPDGLQLAGRRYGWQHLDETPVLCLAGLTRNSADFHELALYLSSQAERPRRVLCLDYRGRGLSQRDRDWTNYNILTEADDTLAGLLAAGVEDAHLIGTSRGGMIAMVLGAMRPTVLKSVVFNDIGPEIDGRGLIRIRNYIEKSTRFDSWAEAALALRTVGQHQFPELDDAEWMEQARRIFEEKNGKIVGRYDPKLLNTLRGLNLDQPIPDLWPQFDGLTRLPIMVVRGENSDILSDETVAKMHTAHPGLRSVTVPDQGHAPDLGRGGLPARIALFLELADIDGSIQ